MSEILFQKSTAVQGLTTVISDGTELGTVQKVGPEWFAHVAGETDAREASHKSRKGAVQVLIDAAVLRAADEATAAGLIPVEGDAVTPLSQDEAAEKLAELLGAAGAEVEAPEGPALVSLVKAPKPIVMDDGTVCNGSVLIEQATGDADDDETPAPKVLKTVRVWCPLCERRVPGKADGSIASHKGFKRTLASGEKARRCDGTREGVKA